MTDCWLHSTEFHLDTMVGSKVNSKPTMQKVVLGKERDDKEAFAFMKVPTHDVRDLDFCNDCARVRPSDGDETRFLNG